MDDLLAWFDGVADDLHTEIDRGLASFDTILVGRVSYDGMATYWPGAEIEEEGSAINKSVARKMNASKKYAFSTTRRRATGMEQRRIGRRQLRSGHRLVRQRTQGRAW